MQPAQIRFLQSSEGQKLLGVAHQHSDIHKRLNILRKMADADAAALVSSQIELRNKAKGKFSHYEQMLFDREGLEQSTSESVARYISRRYEKFDIVADLTCGIGGDAIHLSRVADLIVVDKFIHKVMICAHNLRVYQRNFAAVVANSSNWFPKADAYFIDPSRRHSGQRWFHLEDYEPGIATIKKLVEKSTALGIKVSPGLNYDNLELPCEIEVISLNGECKEIMLWCGDLATTKRRATLLPQNLTMEYSDDEVEISSVGQFIYEVQKAALRAGLVQAIAKQHDLHLVDERLSYLTGDKLANTPWLQAFEVKRIMPFSEKKVKAYIRKERLSNITVKCRGFYGEAVSWQKRLQLKRGDKKSPLTTVFLTRINQDPCAIFTEKINATV
ncbi:THUMP-like domain-containing protein [Candidatus Uabimicrobium amorphum]|uniref:Methyltransferase n=1 Tax=Uabimicrobium amorphum TaxID=2596890 RepID=A0A5S9INK9_UABAM|nr:hypothetical protein [Candidatus Uabimicrobium amorphum]BBM83845.1 methyltransferase [Candidatus Uabimicrobium amorphum]